VASNRQLLRGRPRINARARLSIKLSQAPHLESATMVVDLWIASLPVPRRILMEDRQALAFAHQLPAMGATTALTRRCGCRSPFKLVQGLAWSLVRRRGIFIIRMVFPETPLELKLLELPTYMMWIRTQSQVFAVLARRVWSYPSRRRTRLLLFR
jgi:hypothetical protein